jgi:hypothetical protein
VQTQGADKVTQQGADIVLDLVAGQHSLDPLMCVNHIHHFSHFSSNISEKNRGFPTLKPACMDAAGEDNMMRLSWLLSVGKKIIS